MQNKHIDENFLSATKSWREESVLKLADHFHKLNTESGQHERVSHFTMNVDDLEQFNSISVHGDIISIQIYLAIKEISINNTITFYPILSVTRDGVINYYPLEAETEYVPIDDSDIVPAVFKEMIAKNWMEIDMNLIDDLFLAKKEGVMVRVEFFEVGATMVEYINTLEDIQKITLYAGVDLNKFNDNTLISFTPVLGFTLSESATKTLNHHSVIEIDANEVFIEYSRPCPPTCK